jgi:hypothetical protein
MSNLKKVVFVFLFLVLFSGCSTSKSIYKDILLKKGDPLISEKISLLKKSTERDNNLYCLSKDNTNCPKQSKITHLLFVDVQDVFFDVNVDTETRMLSGELYLPMKKKRESLVSYLTKRSNFFIDNCLKFKNCVEVVVVTTGDSEIISEIQGLIFLMKLVGIKVYFIKKNNDNIVKDKKATQKLLDALGHFPKVEGSGINMSACFSFLAIPIAIHYGHFIFSGLSTYDPEILDWMLPNGSWDNKKILDNLIKKDYPPLLNKNKYLHTYFYSRGKWKLK